MRTEFVLRGTLADAVEDGAASVTVERDVDGETVGAAVETLTDAYPALRSLVVDSKRKLRAHVALRRNGADVRDGEWLQTPLSAGDRLELEPGTKGGC
jgi:molybdopterin converting factor small subunit